MPPHKHVVFICFENANRSQMAEAFARLLGGGRVAAFSAGVRPSSDLKPAAVKVMAEVGYDLTTHSPKGLSDVPQVRWDVVVTMGCGDSCPNLDSEAVVNWEIVSAKSTEELRAVRDVIRDKVQELLGRLVEA